MPRHDKTSHLRMIAAMSKVAIGIGVLIVAMAVWSDPPTGGRNPGGPGAGASIGFAVLRACPWIVIGSIGWAATAWLTHGRGTSS